MRDLTLKATARHSADVYYFRFEHFGWATFTVCDATGELSVQSDWGCYSFRWDIRATGHPTLTDFFRDRADAWYITNKLTSANRQRFEVLDEAATGCEMRQAIIRRRREQSIDRTQARDLWEAIDAFLEDAHESGIAAAMARIDDELTRLFEVPWEYVHFRDCRAVEILREQLIPTFLSELRKADAEAA